MTLPIPSPLPRAVERALAALNDAHLRGAYWTVLSRDDVQLILAALLAHAGVKMEKAG